MKRLKFSKRFFVAAMAALVFPISPEVRAQNQAQQNAPNISESFRVGLEKSMATDKVLLADYFQGKLSDREGFNIMLRIVRSCRELGTFQTPNCQSVYSRWKDLVQRHPELLRHHLPTRVERMQAHEKREEERKERIRKMKETVPQDNYVINFDRAGNKVFVAYQYRAEFYLETDNLHLDAPGNTLKLFKGKQDVALTQLPPKKSFLSGIHFILGGRTWAPLPSP